MPVEDGTNVEAEVARRLRFAPLEVIGRFSDASNATLLVRMVGEGDPTLEAMTEELGRPLELDDLDPAILAVYKPRRGEAPLWDFPPGTLSFREVAAYRISEAMGWDLVPTTVLREDAPIGPGCVQRYVPHDPELHYFALVERGDAQVLAALIRMVVFDLVINNADRKGGHVLLEGPDTADEGGPIRGRVRLIDHGVSMHAEPKLRTVAWDLAGRPPPADLSEALDRLDMALGDDLGDELAELLSAEELAMLTERIRFVRELDQLPHAPGPGAVPWPLL